MNSPASYLFKCAPKPFRFRPFPRSLITGGQWAKLPTSSHAILPVLFAYADKDGVVWRTAQTLAVIAGIDRFRTFPRGIYPLLNIGPEFPITRKPWKTRNGHWSYCYTLPLCRLEHGGMIPIRYALFEGGNWRQLLPSARSLYMAMRACGRAEEYGGDEDGNDDYITGEGMDKGAYARRRSEICRTSQCELMRLAGIKKRETFWACIRSLTKCGLCDPYDDEVGGWRVYLTPRKSFAEEMRAFSK